MHGGICNFIAPLQVKKKCNSPVKCEIYAAEIQREFSFWSLFFSPGYLIVHFVHFLFALGFVYTVVLPICHGRTLSMLYNLGIVA